MSAPRAWRWLAGLALGLVLLLAGLLVLGTRLPREHVAGSRITLRQPAESVWAVMRDLGGMPAWWPAVTVAEPVRREDGQEQWREEADGFGMVVVVEELEPGRRFRTVIQAAPDGDFGGHWTYELIPAAGGTEVRVTETGWIGNPLFRAAAHLGGLHSSVDGYLTALARRFGESVKPDHLAP